jgi:hypothetical protein
MSSPFRIPTSSEGPRHSKRSEEHSAKDQPLRNADQLAREVLHGSSASPASPADRNPAPFGARVRSVESDASSLRRTPGSKTPSSRELPSILQHEELATSALISDLDSEVSSSSFGSIGFEEPQESRYLEDRIDQLGRQLASLGEGVARSDRGIIQTYRSALELGNAMVGTWFGLIDEGLSNPASLDGRLDSHLDELLAQTVMTVQTAANMQSGPLLPSLVSLVGGEATAKMVDQSWGQIEALLADLKSQTPIRSKQSQSRVFYTETGRQNYLHELQAALGLSPSGFRNWCEQRLELCARRRSMAQRLGAEAQSMALRTLINRPHLPENQYLEGVRSSSEQAGAGILQNAKKNQSTHPPKK